MKLIRLTEYIKVKGERIERPILLNPEGIGVVALDKFRADEDEIPIIGANTSAVDVSLITMRNNQRMAVKETLDEIVRLCSGMQIA